MVKCDCAHAAIAAAIERRFVSLLYAVAAKTTKLADLMFHERKLCSQPLTFSATDNIAPSSCYNFYILRVCFADAFCSASNIIVEVWRFMWVNSRLLPSFFLCFYFYFVFSCLMPLFVFTLSSLDGLLAQYAFTISDYFDSIIFYCSSHYTTLYFL